MKINYLILALCALLCGCNQYKVGNCYFNQNGSVLDYGVMKITGETSSSCVIQHVALGEGNKLLRKGDYFNVRTPCSALFASPDNILVTCP
jgi:hypothetical protein